MSFQSFWKPSRLARTVQHWTRRMASQRQREQRARADAATWSAISQQVRTRDRQTCRVCGSLTTRWGIGDPRRWGQAHHLVYRSAGGADALLNLVWLCNQCSADEHEHRISLTGTADALQVERLVAVAVISLGLVGL